MKSNENRGEALIFDTVLPSLLKAMVAEKRTSIVDPSTLYDEAINMVVYHMLGCCYRQGRAGTIFGVGYDEDSCGHIMEALPKLDPEEVGRSYEFLKGFSFEITGAGEPLLKPAGTVRRNQGMFYTPRPIVAHIVRRSLDELKINNATEYLGLKILDPAVGAGIFLEEALNQLSERVLAAAAKQETNLGRMASNLRENIVTSGLEAGAGGSIDDTTAVRIHILERCLYGVDLDSTAIAIAGQRLIRAAFQGMPPIPGVKLNLRVGNSLIGQTHDPKLGKPVQATLDGLDDGMDVPKGLPPRYFHWFLEFPEIFQGHKNGFHAIIGNPPYEILSVKESGIQERLREQAYFRAAYKTCSGKINMYRLMVERALDLLASDGVLGVIVPATLLADSTASKLRKNLLNRSEILEAIIIPEKARVFEKVTQAMLIVVVRKGKPSQLVTTASWRGTGPIQHTGGVKIPIKLIERTLFRIPIIRSEEEKDILEVLTQHPPLGGDSGSKPLGRVHQGEVNLTVHRPYLSETTTHYPLVRGEHVFPFRVRHPSPRPGRLDWVLPELIVKLGQQKDSRQFLQRKSSAYRSRSTPWKTQRIVIGRVVNMATAKRLKAAVVSENVILGDMTNFVCCENSVLSYLTGVLNSTLLNWRLKITSTNNYISAAEIEGLPLPGIGYTDVPGAWVKSFRPDFGSLFRSPPQSVEVCLERLGAMVQGFQEPERSALARTMLEWLVASVQDGIEESGSGREVIRGVQALLDTLVLMVYNLDRNPSARIFFGRPF